MKRTGGLSYLFHSGGSAVSVHEPHQPEHKAIDQSICSPPNNEVNEADESHEQAEHFYRGAQDTLQKNPFKNLFSKRSLSNVEHNISPGRGLQSTWFSLEAPIKFQTGPEGVIPAENPHESDEHLPHTHNSSFLLGNPNSCVGPLANTTNATQFDKLWRKLQKQRSWSTESSRNEAWERRRDLYLSEELKNMKVDGDSRVIGRCISDCSDRTWPHMQQRTSFRSRTLTDDDLEELRGCIDLGFGFGSKEDPHLCNTLPALELCYALKRQLSSPTVSDGSVQTFSSCESPVPLSSSETTWRVSSPGESPQQVKAKLRHWAQAVACNVRQSC